MPSRLKLKLRVTKEPFEPTGAFQHAPIAAPTSSMLRSVRSVLAASPLSTEAVGKRDCGWKLADLHRTGWDERSD
jgi:hypothetical protein